MEDAYRWTIDELVAKHELEPGLCDLYVEGLTDKLFFERFLKECECGYVAVLEIDCVDIPSNLTTRLGLQQGKRDRVVALSLELERLLQQNLQRSACVADSDFDFLLGRKYTSRYLFYTDYTSLDLYFCSESTLEKLLGVFRHPPLDTRILLTNFVEILKEVFLIRAANEKLGWGLQWVRFARCCSLEDSMVVFDCKEFVRRCLFKSNRWGERTRLDRVCQELRAKGVRTYRHRIRARDYLELTAWYVSKVTTKGSSKYRDPEVIRKMIFLTADPESLKKETLFKNLLDIFK